MEILEEYFEKLTGAIFLGTAGYTAIKEPSFLVHLPNHLSFNFSIPAIIGGFVGWELGACAKDEKIKDRIVKPCFFDNGSYPNYIYFKSKLFWKPYHLIRNLLKKKNNSFYLDNFRFDYTVTNYLNIANKLLAKKAEKKDLYLNWNDLKRGSLIIGAMGGGKTEFMKNIMVQWLETNRKIVIHDTKGEFTSWFYDENNDYIINYLDKRGAYWDFFEDIEKGLSVELVYQFFDAYFYAVAGESNDKFWSQSAFLKFKDIFNKVLADNSIKDKYFKFLVGIQKYFDETKANNNKTEQGIAKTLEVTIDIFKKQYAIKVAGRKKFLVTEFFKNPNAKIFLHTISEIQKENTPFLTAFLEVLFRYQLTYFNRVEEKDFVLYVLDEYLTFFEKMKADLRTELHTKARSYGILLLPAVQYLPKKDELKQNLTGSYQNLFVFNTSDLDTLKYIEELTKIKIESRNKFNKKETDFTEKEVSLVDKSYIQNLAPGEHFTYILGDKNVLYKGYTRLVKVEEIEKDFEKDFDFNKRLLEADKKIKEEAEVENF